MDVFGGVGLEPPASPLVCEWPPFVREPRFGGVSFCAESLIVGVHFMNSLNWTPIIDKHKVDLTSQRYVL
jgi:hypothetical protein